MKFVAPVRRIAVRGINKIYIGPSPSDAAMFQDMPDAIRVEIEVEPNCYMFYRYGKGDIFCGDSWFGTLDQAKRQADFEFDIKESDWTEEASG